MSLWSNKCHFDCHKALHQWLGVGVWARCCCQGWTGSGRPAWCCCLGEVLLSILAFGWLWLTGPAWCCSEVLLQANFWCRRWIFTFLVTVLAWNLLFCYLAQASVRMVGTVLEYASIIVRWDELFSTNGVYTWFIFIT